ncbi:MAG TPA: asparagine synthase (glutamine-hydrolyzing), partial [Methylomirabilota bacterium]|nr:asparagine synthase (glutamine-hydrolyzing) [Methylomirabilota bacterium]
MCGIAGVFRYDGGPVDADSLAAMSAAVSHRGPDGLDQDIQTVGSLQVGLGHARLRIIDLSAAASQPMVSDDGAVSVTFNGEIYNFRELRARLQARGVRFRTASDTEVILRVYEAEGPDAITSLDGMFAFALWDAHRRMLLLARDRVGKKPLFYASGPGWLVFASEIKALMRWPELAVEVDPGALPAFFLYGYVPTPATPYRGIRQLPPGHCLSVDGTGATRLWGYWELPPAGPPPAEGDATGRVRELVTDAVRRRLVADVPLGAFLSGGIDSTIVVGVMSQLMGTPVRTFSIGFAGDPRFDERRYARLAARHFGTEHTEFVVEPSAVDLVDRLVYHHDGPFADSSAVPTYLLSRLTRQHVTVALNGDGGDELFAGYLRFYAALLAERVPAGLRRAAR